MNKDNLKCFVHIGYCKGHETLIARHQERIKVYNVISKKDLLKHPNLIVKGEIIINKEHCMAVPEVKIRLDNYFPAVVGLWPADFIVNSQISLPLYSESDLVTKF